MPTEKNTSAKRAKRYAQTTAAVGGVAMKLLGEKYLGLNIDRAAHSQDIQKALGNLKGPLMKVAQLLATIPGALPEEYNTELMKLQANAPPMGWVFVKRRMQNELGMDWQKKFKNFEQNAAHAASLGQVHCATHKNNTTLACKLQYPDMQSTVTADIKQLKLILSLYGKYDNAIDTKNIANEVADRLREELDYTREAKHMAMFAHMLKNEKHIHIPKTFPDLSTDRLLTMEFLTGTPLLDFVTANKKLRNQLAQNMFRAWYIPFYQYGIIHGDPHLGNYTIRKNGDVNLLDFGCVRIFSPKFVHGVIELYHATKNKDRNRAIAAYKIWGFRNLKDELVDTLNIWAEFIYGPLLENKTRLLGKNEKNKIYGRDTAIKVHQKLRDIGGVSPPREFVFMDRAALGLGSVFLHLKAELNWHEMFHGLIDGFDQKDLAKNQKSLLKKFHLAPLADSV